MKELVSILSAFVLGTGILILALPAQTIDLTVNALGESNSEQFEDYKGQRVHCSVFPDINECLRLQVKRQNAFRALWLGNSQLHGINQRKENDQAAPILVTDSARLMAIDLVTLSQPNASLQEHLHILQYALSEYTINLLILPIVFDDLREDGIRKSLALPSDQDITGNTPDANSPFIPKPGDLQTMTEEKLEAIFSDMSEFWGRRGELRGQISLTLYQTRNYVFQINPSSTRRMIPGRYKKNMDSLVTILRMARDRKIPVLAYIPPLRGDVPRPYDPDEYASFKRQINAIVRTPGVYFVDLENLVPGEFWGEKAGTSLGRAAELDFMHFQGKGHKLLAKAIKQELISMSDDF
jgi:hypothetical protein